MHVNRRDVLKQFGVGAAVLIGGPAISQGRASAQTPTGSGPSSDVSFVGATPSGSRRSTIVAVLEPWRSHVAAGIAGKTVLLKANMVGLSSGPVADQTLPVTHVDALRGVLDFVRSISASVPVVIGDCSAAPNMSRTWSRAGYTALTTEYTGVTLMELGAGANPPTTDLRIWKPDLSTTTTIPIIGTFTDPNYYVISLTKPKTHDVVVMSGTTKNILMAAPMRTATVNGTSVFAKFLMHGRGAGATGRRQDEAKCLSYNLFQLANVIYPKHAPALCVLDAWEGMQGDGPIDGSSIMQYCAVAGIDSLAVDRLGAVLMGFTDPATGPADPARPNYADVRYLTWISNAGFGNYDLSRIAFVRGSLSQLQTYVKPYTMHSAYADEIGWSGGPPDLIESAGERTARSLDPRPFLVPQSPDAVRAGDVEVAFALPVDTVVRLGIVTTQGIEVRSLAHTHLGPGRYTVSWDGRDSHGSRVPSGDYVVRLGFRSLSSSDQERSLEDLVRIVR